MRVPNKLRIKILTGLCLCLLASTVLAGGSSSLTLGGMASEIIGSFTSLTKLITSAAYLAGLGFMVGAIFKFKQHKDTPQQITIGQPIALLIVGASLLFMPTILDVAGATMFGSSGGTTAGPTGTVFSSGG
jgi:intracellular multiplication protein IcmD